MSWWRGLDVVIGYQVSWILMFADYSRYTRRCAAARSRCSLGLAVDQRLDDAARRDRGARRRHERSGRDAGRRRPRRRRRAAARRSATLTTNFVNIYMSSLAWKSLMPRASDTAVIWSIGIVGTALSAVPGVWLEQYTNFMIVLGALLVPVGGVLVAHYYIRAAAAGRGVDRASCTIPPGRFAASRSPGITAWAAGAAAFFAARIDRRHAAGARGRRSSSTARCYTLGAR